MCISHECHCQELSDEKCQTEHWLPCNKSNQNKTARVKNRSMIRHNRGKLLSIQFENVSSIRRVYRWNEKVKQNKIKKRFEIILCECSVRLGFWSLIVPMLRTEESCVACDTSSYKWPGSANTQPRSRANTVPKRLFDNCQTWGLSRNAFPNIRPITEPPKGISTFLDAPITFVLSCYFPLFIFSSFLFIFYYFFSLLF